MKWEGGIVAMQDSGIGLGSCASILQDYYLRFSCSLVGGLTHNTIEEGGIVAVQDSGIGLGSCTSIL
jgi:hypothetical protein